MVKREQTAPKAEVITKTQNTLYRVPEVPVSERKLDTHITIGFAKKTPKFVAEGRHIIIYEK